jgi:polysaccharide biosynthesis/export protein
LSDFRRSSTAMADARPSDAQRISAMTCSGWQRVLCLALLGICSCGLAAKTGQSGRDNSLSAGTTQSLNRTIFADEKFTEERCIVPQLAALWQERDHETVADLPVGPGDVISLSVPEIDEIQNQRVRVSALGTISLPLIGTLQVAGMSENELRQAIELRLSKYMKTPRVELFVENYRSRSVAIVGAVQKPGYYDMAEDSNSLMDMIGLAGGLSPVAAQKIIFSPARIEQRAHEPLADSDQGGQIVPAGAASAIETSNRTASSQSRETQHSIVLNLDMAGDVACLSMPARPGDAVLVPVAGQVMVQGWVQNPGAFNVTPGMTLLGAVSAAGGATFSWTAELLRGDAHGGKQISEYSLPKLQSGEEQDPSVQSGDVVLVERSAIGAIPYTIFTLFEHFGSGVGFPVP